MLFWRKSPKPRPKPQALRSIPAPYLVAYRGSVPALPVSEFYLFCVELSGDYKAALLRTGFNGIGNSSNEQVYIYYCTVKLRFNDNSPRILFNLFVDLSAVPKLFQKALAIKIADGLAHRLKTCETKGLLIRCIHQYEFDWCLEDWRIDDDWLMELELLYKRHLDAINLLQ